MKRPVRRGMNGAGKKLGRNIESVSRIRGMIKLHCFGLAPLKSQGAQLVIVVQLQQLAIGMAAGVVIIGHAALSTFAAFFCIMTIINRSKGTHAIMQVNRYPAGHSQVKKG